jgi:pilus assembly protein CpaC
MSFHRSLLWAVMLLSLQLGSCVGISAAMAQPAPAASQPSAPRHVTPTAQPSGARLISTQAAAMRIEVNKGRLVRLDQPAASVFLADPNIADIQVKSPTLVYVFGKKAGETSLFAVDKNDELLANFRIAVTHNLSGLEQALRDYMPDAYIKASSLGDAVVLTGVVRSAKQAEDARSLAARLAGGDANVINRIAVKGPTQVNLRVRVAEVSRATVKQLGFNWETLFSPGNFAFGIATGSPVFNTSVRGAATDQARRFLIGNTSAGGATDSIVGGFTAGSVDVNTVIDALENEGLLTILAEPNLTATSGETASFLAGGEFPVPVPQKGDTITIQFKKFGVGLSFTPTILDDGRISLHVRPEVSQLSSNGEVRINGFAVPALTTRRADTTVELGSGQSFAIAGLLQNNIAHDLRRFPGLGDLPILGPLFRSDGFRRNETELVIVATPYIVKPVSNPQMVSLPTDGLMAPNDAERLGRDPLYRPQQPIGQPKPAMTSGRRLIGSIGFTLD